MPFSMVIQDITRMEVDAVVNAANEDLLQGGGVCGAIFAAAGAAELTRACNEIGHVDCGGAVATPGFALPARHIIHTAGPIWHGGTYGERELLQSCYRSSLELAERLGATSIAFPLISSGIYGYPPDQALAVANSTIRDYLRDSPDLEVTLCLLGRGVTTLAEDLFESIERYVEDEREVLEPFDRVSGRLFPEALTGSDMRGPSRVGSTLERLIAKDRKGLTSADGLDDLLETMDEPFEVLLLAMIDERGLTDAEVYNRANLSRQYFSKLRSGKLNPSKRVVLSLAVALELTPAQAEELLGRAGYALSRASKFDLIVEWFIAHGRYDVYEINEALFRFDQPLLGSTQ